MIGIVGGVQDVLAAMRAFPNNAELFWLLFCTVEGAVEVIGTVGGVQDVLAAMRAFPNNAELFWLLFCTVEGAAEVIGVVGGVQDVLAAMRAFPNNAELCATCCNALWSLSVNGEYFLSLFPSPPYKAYTPSLYQWWYFTNTTIVL